MKRPFHPQKEDISVLHGFRALMILWVANFHIYQQSWMRQTLTLFSWKLDLTGFTYSGFLFVDGLMLLSGFLLFLPYTRPFIKEPSCWSFYYKRFRRIVPSYELAILFPFFFIALPACSYSGTREAIRDLLSHVCFLQMFNKQTYLNSPLNSAVWTMVVEMQFYLLFPLLAKWARKKPALTLPGMAVVGWLYRYLVGSFCSDTAALVNQFPAYLDLFALGMAGALLYRKLEEQLQSAERKIKILASILATILFLGSCYGCFLLTEKQTIAASKGYEALRLSQMTLEFPFGLLILLAMLGACFSIKPLQWLLGNRLMRFLSQISMNFYVWHQLLAVQIRLHFFPDLDALHHSLQSQSLYTLTCYLAAFVLAMALTYGWEQPCSRLLDQIKRRFKFRQSQQSADR